MEKREHAAGRSRTPMPTTVGKVDAAGTVESTTPGVRAAAGEKRTDERTDERKGEQAGEGNVERTRQRQASKTAARTATPALNGKAAPLASDVDEASEVSSNEGKGDIAPVSPEVERAALALDPRRPEVVARLQVRHSGGAYEVSEADLVRAIRVWAARGEQGVVRALSEVLVRRCMPEFQRRSWGLRHRPELMEDAIAGMIEQLLREAQDPREEFMTLNFIHYLHCLCADNFGRVLRAEGLSYRRDAQGRPVGRPLHVPRALIERLDVEPNEREEEGGPTREVAEPGDPLGKRMAALEAERILAYLPDPLDQKIMVLRALEHMRWDDIAAICGKTERTMRLRYEKARSLLRERLEAEVLSD